MSFIRNGWYVAAWPDEITEKPLARRLGNQPIVLYREKNGKVAALLDRCPHRAAPLSLGVVTATGLQCNYHGMILGSDGKCRSIPNQSKIPSKACVKSFPISEKDGFVWIWLGDPEKADESKIVNYPYHKDEKTWPRRTGMMRIEGHYMLVVDNLMDLTHIGYMHKKTIGSGPAGEYTEALMDTQRTGTGVRFTRWLLNHTPPATYVKAVGFKGKVDRWQEFEFVAPGGVLMYTGATDAGTGAYDKNKRDGGIALRIFHALTPETDSSCLYFFSTMTGYNQEDPDTTVQYHNEILKTFVEDAEFIAGQQARLDEYPEPQIDTIHDTARVQARRYYQGCMDQEAREAAGSDALAATANPESVA